MLPAIQRCVITGPTSCCHHQPHCTHLVSSETSQQQLTRQHNSRFLPSCILKSQIRGTNHFQNVSQRHVVAKNQVSFSMFTPTKQLQMLDSDESSLSLFQTLASGTRPDARDKNR